MSFSQAFDAFINLDSNLTSLQKIIQHEFKRCLKSLLNDLLPDDFKIAISRSNPMFGDYQCNNVLALFKFKEIAAKFNSKKTLADEIAMLLDSTLFSDKITSDAGFITVKMNFSYLKNIMFKSILEVDKISITATRKATILLDYSSPNVAKEMHVGHLRSTIYGEGLSRILNYIGHKVMNINHIGDWGTQFGMIIEYILKYYYNDYINNNIDLHKLGKIYKEAKKLFDDDTEFANKSRARVVLLQKKEHQTYTIWRKLVDISMEEFNIIYDKLGIKLEVVGESFYNDIIPSVISICENQGLVDLINGAKCIFAKDKRIGNNAPLIVQKSDSGYGYDSTDLAALYYRLITLDVDWIIYITDKGQHDHFSKLFDVGTQMKWDNNNNKKMTHIGLGLICDSNGKKFKTRSGETVKLLDLLNEGINRAKIEIIKKNPENFENLDLAAEKLAYSAIRYYDLNQVHTIDYIFSYDKMLDNKGNTAIYLIYSYARMNSLLNKLLQQHTALIETNDMDKLIITTDAEYNLILHCLRFTECIENTLKTLSLHIICEFCYELAKKFSEFYEKCRIIDSDHVYTRGKITLVAHKVLQQALTLIGIEVVDRL